MPIYEYRCAKGHTFEVIHAMSDDPPTGCEVCGAAVERVFRAPAVHFKGSGFYTTDYAKKGAGASGTNSGSDSKGDSKPESKSESKSDSKQAKTESKSKD